MSNQFETLIRDRRPLDALRLLFSDESEVAVLEFLDAAEDDLWLKGAGLLLALDLAEKSPSDVVLIALERALRSHGLSSDADAVAADLRPLGPALKSAVDAVVSKLPMSQEGRQSVLAELLNAPPLSEPELAARETTVRLVRQRLCDRRASLLTAQPASR